MTQIIGHELTHVVMISRCSYRVRVRRCQQQRFESRVTDLRGRLGADLEGTENSGDFDGRIWICTIRPLLPERVPDEGDGS